MPDRVLTDDQLDCFRREGFVVAPGLLDHEATEALIRAAREVEAMPEVPGRQMVYWETSQRGDGTRMIQRIENFYPYHEWFHALFDGPLLKGAMDELFAEPSVLYKDKINLKLPGGDGFKPHQDQQAGWSLYAPIFITALVCIDQATVENGCLEIAGGQHDKGLIGPEWEPLSDETRGDVAFVPVPTAPGDAIFFDSYTPHGSQPNLTDKARRVLYVTYNRVRDGGHRERYFADKRASFPPDIERDPDKVYRYRV